jgi:hypothetical protein
MRDDNTGWYFPQDVNIMFISLPRLSEESGFYGDLARLLLGAGYEGTDETLLALKEMFSQEFQVFKENEEVLKSMNIDEITRAEGRAEGEASTKARYNVQLKEMLLSGQYKKEESVALIDFAERLGIKIENLDVI